MTRHLHACISLDAAAPPSPEFRFDPCRSLAHDYDDQIVDDRYQPFDRTACPPGESDPDAPNPASGTDAEPIAEQ
jgi:hypothetical protein